MYCAQCGNQNPDGSKFCQGCGSRIAVEEPGAGAPPPQQPPPNPEVPTALDQAPTAPSDGAPPATGTVEPTCPNCNTQVEAGKSFCPNCGAGLGGNPARQQPAVPVAPVAPVVPSPQAAMAPRPGVTLAGAGAGRRFLAVLIDLILFGAAVFVLYQQFGTGGLTLDTGGLDIKKMTLDYDNWYIYYSSLSDFLYLLVPLLGGILYVIVFEGTFGWTLGKLIMGVRVVKTDGRRSGFLAAVLRLIFWVIDFFLIGLIMVLVTKRKQRLGDMVAGTVVAGRKDIKASRQGAVG